MTLTALGMPALRSRTNGIADPRVVPTTGPLVDTFGRVANDLRVSLTDRCNLRCSYCMPERGLRWLPGEQLLRPDELARLIHIAVTRLGVTSVRFTGGEPLLAHHLDEVVAATARLRPRSSGQSPEFRRIRRTPASPVSHRSRSSGGRAE